MLYTALTYRTADGAPVMVPLTDTKTLHAADRAIRLAYAEAKAAGGKELTLRCEDRAGTIYTYRLGR